MTSEVVKHFSMDMTVWRIPPPWNRRSGMVE